MKASYWKKMRMYSEIKKTDANNLHELITEDDGKIRRRQVRTWLKRNNDNKTMIEPKKKRNRQINNNQKIRTC